MKKQVFVGGTLKEAAARVAEAWRRADYDEIQLDLPIGRQRRTALSA